MNLNFPKTILMKDVDEGVFVAVLIDVKETNDGEMYPVYKQKEYYHSLSDAMKDLE